MWKLESKEERKHLCKEILDFGWPFRRKEGESGRGGNESGEKFGDIFRERKTFKLTSKRPKLNEVSKFPPPLDFCSCSVAILLSRKRAQLGLARWGRNCIIPKGSQARDKVWQVERSPLSLPPQSPLLLLSLLDCCRRSLPSEEEREGNSSMDPGRGRCFYGLCALAENEIALQIARGFFGRNFPSFAPFGSSHILSSSSSHDANFKKLHLISSLSSSPTSSGLPRKKFYIHHRHRLHSERAVSCGVGGN